MRGTLVERFWAKVDKSAGPGGCWLWMASTNNTGYGQTWKDGHKAKAHRIAWEFCLGPIPTGMLVCHHCDNPICVNPAHLFLGTVADNARDMAAKGRSAFQAHPERAPHGERHWGAKLTETQVGAIRSAYAEGGVTQQELSLRYGVNESAINEIIHRKAWKHVL
jgi:hypothetical protein